MSSPGDNPSSTRRYHPIIELGRGGMAEVYLSVTRGQGGFTKLVVLKKTRAEFSQDPDFVTMFLDEARLAARLNHPNVVQTYEVGQEGDQYFIAMEYLDGQPLNRARNLGGRREPMPLLHQVAILCGVLSGLHHAHELCDFDGTPLRVVHRDISPHNVFVTYDGHVKVVDFGIAKAAGAAAQTQQGAIKGKLAYMPPEQATGKQVDRRADIFAVGVMLWEALAGQRMWAAIPESGILFRLSTHDLPSLEEAAPDAPPQLVEIARKALAPAPDQRYGTAAEMEAALSAYLAAQPQRVTPADLGRYLSRHFEEQRARIKRAVEDQMREFREDRSSREIPVFPPSSEGPASGFEAPDFSPTPTRPQALGPTPVAYHIAAPTLQSLPGPRPARGNPARKAAVLGFLCATIGVAGGVFVALRLTAPKASQQPGVPPPPNAPASSSGAAQPPPLVAALASAAPSSQPPLVAPPASAHSATPATGAPRHQDFPGKPSSKTSPPADDRAAFGGRKLPMRSPRFILPLLLLGAASTTAPARGQTPEAKAQAETLFEEGVKKLDAREYAPACKAFEASNRLDPGLGTLLYLADCYEKLGKTASAWAAFREAASLAKAAGQAEREAVAQRRAASLSSRLSRVTLVVPPEADHPGLLILRNGMPVPREIWGMPMPVDPGKHEYEVSAPGKKASRLELELKPTEDARALKLSPLEDAAEVPPTPSSSAPASAAPPSTPAPIPTASDPPTLGTQRTAGLIVAGVGLLGTGLGAYLALRARSQSEDADALCRPEDRTRCGAEGARLGNDARSSANLATAAFSLGTSALLGGTLLYLLAPSSTATGRPRLLPALGPAHAGLSLGGAW